MITYLDACPKCPPGIPPASPAMAGTEQVPGGTITNHQCEACGAAWSTFWDRYGWPVDRLLAPVALDDAARNRETLEREIRTSRPAGWPAREAA